MSIYTHYEMVRDCRANKPEGWSHFITNYIPACRVIAAHYYPERADDRELVGRVLVALRDPGSPLYREGSFPERQFVAELRQVVLAAIEQDRPSVTTEAPPELETLSTALEPFTAVERQVLWLECMGYDGPSAARMLNISEETVTRIRDRGAEALRAHLDHWSRGILGACGPALGRAAADARTEDCLHAAQFLDMLDGRITWARRQNAEQHLTRCWHCVDHSCRLREVDWSLRDLKPLAEEDAARFFELLGLPARRKSFWKR